MTDTMTIVDAHQHYWMLRRGDYRWLTPGLGTLYQDFMPEHLQATLAACSVSRTILVQAAATEEETRFLIELSRAHGSIAAVVGWVDFEDPDVSERVRRLASDCGPKLVGLRPMVQDIADPAWLAQASIDRAFDAIVERGMTFDALVKPAHFEALAQRLRRHPDLRVVLDHAGKPDIAGRGFDVWAAGLAQLARFDSLQCKLSGLLTEAHADVRTEHLDPYIAHIFACFGPDRVIWGSDWPVVTLRATYTRWLQMAHELVRRHAPGSHSGVFSANATRFYRIDESTEHT